MNRSRRSARIEKAFADVQHSAEWQRLDATQRRNLLDTIHKVGTHAVTGNARTYPRKVLQTASAKTVKGQAHGFLTGICYLAPHKLSGHNVCGFASAGCVATCLNTAGRGRFDAIQNARISKTEWFFADRASFIAALHRDIKALIRKARRDGMKPVVRLNGTSDLRFEQFARDLFDAFPEVQFYDYTKNPAKMNDYLAGLLPSNYHVTWSMSETNVGQSLEFFYQGANVAFPYRVDGAPKSDQFARLTSAIANDQRFAPFRTSLPAGAPLYIVDGDSHDLTFLHAPFTLVALTAKGRAKHDATGFVVRF